MKDEHSKKVNDKLIAPLLSFNEAGSGHKIDNDKQAEGFSPFIAVCFILNFMVGTGFLTLPWAFVQGGLILSTILMLAASVIQDYIKDFLLVGMARAEAFIPREISNGLTSTVEDANMTITETETEDDTDVLLVKDRKFEITDLCRMFLGERASLIFVTLLSFSLFMTLWVYTVVFDTVFQNVLPIFQNDDSNAILYTFIYGFIVIPIACLELKEQIFIQITLAMCRVLMFVFMVTTTFFFPDDFRGHGEKFISAPLYSFAGMSKAIPIMLFALQFQTTIPGISHAVADKRQLSGIFRFTFYLAAICYIFVGVTVASAGGLAGTAQSSNIMFQNFRGGTGTFDPETGTFVDVALWAKVISYFVLMFPAVDVISAFPLNAIVYGNNLLDVAYRGEHAHLKLNRTRIVAFRLFASVPPVICALFIRSLGAVTDYAGIVFFAITFCFPALIYVYSNSDRVATTKKSYYESCGTNVPFAYFTFWVGILMFFYLLITLTMQEFTST